MRRYDAAKPPGTPSSRLFRAHRVPSVRSARRRGNLGRQGASRCFTMGDLRDCFPASPKRALRGGLAASRYRNVPKGSGITSRMIHFDVLLFAAFAQSPGRSAGSAPSVREWIARRLVRPLWRTRLWWGQVLPAPQVSMVSGIRCGLLCPRRFGCFRSRRGRRRSGLRFRRTSPLPRWT